MIYGTKRLNANGDEVSGSSDLELTNPILFWPIDADTAELSSTNSKTDAVSKAWSEIMDEILMRLNSSNKVLTMRLQQSLKEFDSQDSNAMNDMEVSAAEPEIVIVAESEVEVRAESPRHVDADDAGVRVESQNSPHSSSAPVQRARTKADLRLGGLRLVSSPKDLILPRPSSPVEREMKRARLSPSAFGGQPICKQDGVNFVFEGSDADRQRGADDQVPARTEHDAKERQLLGLKLAARLNRLQQAGADLDAKIRSPSPPAHPMSVPDLPSSPTACPMSDQEAVHGVVDDEVLTGGAHLQRVDSETEIPDTEVSGTAEPVNVGGAEAPTSAEELSARQGADKVTDDHQTFAPALDAPAKRHTAASNLSSARPSQPSPKIRSKPAVEAHPPAASLEQRARHADGPRQKPAEDPGRTADSATLPDMPEASGGNRRPPSTSKKASGNASRADAAEEQGRVCVPATNSRSCRDTDSCYLRAVPVLAFAPRVSELIDATRPQAARGRC